MATTLTVVLAALLAAAVLTRRRPRPRRRSRPGAGTIGTVYDLLNEDKRRAVEIIVEQKAEATDPETADDVVR
jgi:hypothetical protein